MPAVVAGLVLLAAAATASAAPPQPRVTFPATGVPAGAEGAIVTASIENPRGAERIGSANLVPPAGFKVLGAALSGTGAGGGTAEVLQDGTLALRKLALAAGTSLQVRLTLEVPCKTVPPSRWGVTVKSSTSFDGNSIAIAPASALATGITGTCTLRWGDPLPPPATGDDREPADAKVGAVITSVAHVESAPAVRVAVYDGANRPVRSAVGAVEVVLVGSGDAADLSGATSALGAPDGYATFPALRVDDRGTYGLRASVTDKRFAGLTSKVVVIRGDTVVKGCDAFGPCPTGSLVEGPAGRGPAGYSVSAPSGQRATFLTLSVDAGVSLSEADCGGWVGYAGSTALFNETSNTRTTVIAATVDKVEMNRVAENGAPRLELCFAAPKSFPAKDEDGVPGTAKLSVDTFDWNADGREEPVYTGLLRDCPIVGKPCITKRKKVGSLDGFLSESGNGYIEAIVPPGLGDPAMRP